MADGDAIKAGSPIPKGAQVGQPIPSGASIGEDITNPDAMLAKAQGQAQETPATAAAKMQPNYAALMLENSPSGADPHNPGNPNLNAIPETERKEVSDTLANTALATTPLMGAVGSAAAEGLPGVMRLGRGLIGAGTGAWIGERGGADVGGLFGDTGRKIGGTGGAIVGGLLGGGLAGGLERSPVTNKVNSLPFGVQRAIPDWMVPGGVPEDELARGAFMNRGYKPQIGAGESVTSQIGSGKTASGLPDVIHAPITSESRWLQRPEGNIQNVPRTQLPGMIQRTGDPAAVKEARRLGSAVLYVPEEYQK